MLSVKQASSKAPITIDLAEEKSQLFWASALGVSIEKLKSAVRATRSVDYVEVRRYLHAGEKDENLKRPLYAKN